MRRLSVEGVMLLHASSDLCRACQHAREKSVEGVPKHVLELEELQIGEHAPENALRLSSPRRADRRERLRGGLEAESHGARARRMKKQELDDALGLDAADVQPLIRLVGAATLQHRGPAQARERPVGRPAVFFSAPGLGVEDAQRLVRSLEELAELDELPALVVIERRVDGALEEVAAGLYRLEELVR